MLCRCKELTDAAVFRLASKCTRLSSFSVAECLKMTDKSVVALASACGGRLRHVDLYKIYKIG